ncbi:MAG: MotA/TolQ/ExbB proton channel family protein [Kiritimatiellales bacterium]|nr:MotA/TolQ/ExbB proton channel family protein [Kiritimatiellales bacterium]
MKKTTRWIFVLICCAASMAWAQEAGADSDKLTFLDLVMQGGWAMIPLGLLSMAMIFFIVQNFVSLRSKTLLHSEMMPEFLEMMVKGESLKALEHCREKPTMFTLIFGAGLERCVDDEDDEINFDKVKESVEEATVEQLTQLMKPIDYLSIIGAIAPMLGLLGTVSGMIKAFHTMGTQGMGKPELLAGNIGEALMTTATGLVIAIPAMLFYFYFKKGFNKTLATLGRNLGFLFDALEKGKMPMAFRDLSSVKKDS